MTAVTTARAVPAARRTLFDLGALAAATVALRLPAFTAERHLTFDDGVYGASAVAMRAGFAPFRDVFSSQGPLFLPLLWIGDLLGLRTANAPRVLSLVAGVALVVVTYLAGRAVTDRGGALLAAGLTSVCASVVWVTAPSASDGVALAFATTTMLLTLRWREDVTLRRAVWLGASIGATVSVKALLVPVVLPVAVVLLAGRRVAPIVGGALTAIVLHLALWVPWGPGNVWDQSYGYHLEVASELTPGANLGKVLSTLGDRDLPLVAAVVVAAIGVAVGRRAPRRDSRTLATSADTLLALWLAGTVVVLLTEHPLWRPHVSQLVPALALLAARHRPSLRVLAVAAVVVAPYHVVHLWPLLAPTPYAPSSQEVLDHLGALPPGALAISDDPGIVWRSGRRPPPDLVDASILRIQTGDITAASLAEVAAQPDVCAVAVRSRVRWGSFRDLPDRLTALGYEVALEDARGRRLYVRPDCEP